MKNPPFVRMVIAISFVILLIAVSQLPSSSSSIAWAEAANVKGILNERITDGNRQIFVLTWYELNTSDETKKIQMALYCKNLSALPAVCVQASSLKVLDSEGNEYSLEPTSYFPTLRIPSHDVIALYLRFDLPVNSDVSTLIVGAADHRVEIDLNKKFPEARIPTSSWQVALDRGVPKDPEKMMKVLASKSDRNLLLMEVEVSNVGFLETTFNSAFMYLKDNSNTVYSRASVPSSTEYEPKLNVITLGRGEVERGWIAFSIGAFNDDKREYMLAYDEPNGSFLNTGVFVDNINPHLVLPSSISVEAGNSKIGTIVTYNVTAYDDHSNPVSLSCDPENGSLFGLGETIVTCRATDSAGNSESGSFSIRVGESFRKPVDNILRIDGNDYVITSISDDAQVKAFIVNKTGTFIEIETDSQKEEEITLTFPKEVIDGISFVTINGQDIPFDKLSEDELYTSIKFTLPASVQYVQVHGEQVIPEFGIIGAAIVFTVMTAMAYIVTKMNGLGIYRK